MFKRLLISVFFILNSSFLIPALVQAQGWPENYGGVMLQGFYWDSYSQTRWTKLTSQADQLAEYFDLIWVPNSGYCSQSNNMGYLPLYYWNQNSSFGTEAELRTMISTFKAKGLGTIADVVINHHNTNGWFGFPAETYKGQTYQFQSTDICANDDGGAAKTEADQEGVSLSANNDTGEDWSGCRDLDHNSSNVNRIVKAYEDYLLNDLGYTGFRYDMVVGYGSKFIADYNSTANVRYSVGECWKGSNTIKNWINGTKVDDLPQSAAFDFQFRYRVRDAFNGSDVRNLKEGYTDADGAPLSYDKNYQRYAITFVENHDTQYRSESEPLDPLKVDTAAANAYMLCMPGTPCVFLAHWIAKKPEIRRQITLRKIAGITNQSNVTNLYSTSAGCFANKVEGNNGSIIIVVGSGCGRYTPTGYTDSYTKVYSGTHYAIWLNNDKVSDWTAAEAKIAETEQKEKEEEEKFTPYTATIYVQTDFTPVYFYAWDTAGTLLGDWPGKDMTDITKTVDDEEWYYAEFPINQKSYEFSIIFNQGSGKPQTSDITNLNAAHFYKATIKDGAVVYTDVTSEHKTGIDEVKATYVKTAGIYDISGRKLNSVPEHGMFIINGKKVIK